MIRSTSTRTNGRGSPCAAGLYRLRGRSLRPAVRQLSERQIEAIHTVMQLFVEDDLANGMAGDAERDCRGCGRVRPAAGFIRYGDADVCNTCATNYELARVSGEVTTFDRFLRRG